MENKPKIQLVKEEHYEVWLHKAQALIPFIAMSVANRLFSLLKTELNHLSYPILWEHKIFIQHNLLAIAWFNMLAELQEVN